MGITMALVPIIYTSLLIFTSLLLFVTIVSYISFKSRTRDKFTFPNESIAMQQNSIAFSPTNLNFNNLPAKPVTVQYRQSINYPIVNTDNDQVRINFPISSQSPSQRDAENDFHSSQIKGNIKVEPLDKFQNSKRVNQKSTFSRSRIEIMNNSVQFKTTSTGTGFENIHNSINPGNKISEKNLFDYYSDKNDLGFVILAATIKDKL